MQIYHPFSAIWCNLIKVFLFLCTLSSQAEKSPGYFPTAIMKRQTFKTDSSKTIDWLKGNVVDWASGGQLYSFDGQQRQIGKYNYAFSFDASITSLQT